MSQAIAVRPLERDRSKEVMPFYILKQLFNVAFQCGSKAIGSAEAEPADDTVELSK